MKRQEKPYTKKKIKVILRKPNSETLSLPNGGEIKRNITERGKYFLCSLKL